MIYKFTGRAKKAIEIANDIAQELGHNYVGTEHILYGLIKEGSGVANKVLENQNVDAEKIKNEIVEFVGKGEDVKQILGFTPRAKRVLENGFLEAKKMGYDYIGTEHLLIGSLKEGDSIATRILIYLDVDLPKIYNEIMSVANEVENINNINEENQKNIKSKNSFVDTPTLNQFGTDLTKKAEKRIT